ncbi:MAG: class 1 fructose-bisphosphatase [Proteobacteria bacterium]|nr:MAG: class 1 fructose-bisphosphatase [Pseudomonadota bacterium]
MNTLQTTLSSFIIDEQRRLGRQASGQFTGLLNDIGIACKSIAALVNKGELAGVLGVAGSENVMGDAQKKMDLIANDLFINALQYNGHCAGMASEELDEILTLPEGLVRGRYLVTFDPLDGSSNMDINIDVGAIFSILKAPESGEDPTAEDFARPGVEQVAAGYCLYGPASMFVLTTGNGVNGFTLDTSIGEFILTHPDMKIPETTSEFSINASNQRHWEPAVQRYIADCVAGETGPLKKNYNMRWVAAMVGEIHRILCRGGVFLYPIDERNRKAGGKLRLLYEGNPMAMIVEQAGGLADTGYGRIMEVIPNGDPHQRVAVIMGSKQEVETILRYHEAG